MGVIATLIDWVIFYTIYNLVGINYLVCKVVAFMVATVFNYVLSMRYVFRSRHTSKVKEFNIFLGLSVFNLLLTLGGMYIMVDILGVSPNIANVWVAFVVMVVSFVMRKLLIEGKK